mgnify:CR=1 FL=1
MKSLIGPHASISKGILNAIKYAEDIGGNSLQIFLGSNQSTSLKMKTKVSDEEIEAINKHLKTTKTVLVIHTVYLLNFCNHPPSNSSIKYALDNLIFDIKLTARLGGIGCVLHIGYKKDLDEDEAYSNMVENVKYTIDKTKDCPSVKIILETPAGKGSQIGTSLEEFTRIWKAFPKSYHSRLGICVDTAHIFSSGIDISSVEGTKKYFADFDKLIGLKYLTLFHINDSKALCNSRKDQHEGIGDGHIYDKDKGGDLLALKEIHTVSLKHNIPMVLETHSGGYYDAPKDMGKYAQEISLFRGWDNNNPIHADFKLIEKPISKPSSTPKTEKTKPKKTKKKTPPKKKKASKKKSPSNQLYKKYPINLKIVEIFQELSHFYEMEKNSIRRNAYDKAVYQLKRYSKKITVGREVLSLPNVGKKMVEKIDEIIATNELQTLNKLRKLYKSSSTTSITTNDSDNNNISNILGFGVKKAEEIKNKFKLETLSDLENYIIKNNRNIELNLTTQQKIGMKHHKDLMTKIPRSEATKIYKKVVTVILSSKKAEFKANDLDIELAGSFASSYTEESKDIDILIITNKYKNKSSLEESNILSLIIEELINNKVIINTLSLGKTKFLGLIQLTSKSKVRHLDMRIVTPQSYIYAKLYYTSGATFNKMMREKAKKENFKLNEWGLYQRDTNKQVPSIKTEEDIFKKIKMNYVALDERR